MEKKQNNNQNNNKNKNNNQLLFDVYIYQDIYDQIMKNCINGGELEVFGYLIGEVFEWKNKKYIEIEEQLFLKEAGDSKKYTIHQLEGFAPQFHKMLKNLREKRGKNYIVVGWWHSHPNYGCFLSSTDVTTAESFFASEDYQVSLVVDPIRNEIAFFKIDHNYNDDYKEVPYAIIKKSN